MNDISKKSSLFVSFISIFALSFLVIQNLSQETIDTITGNESDTKDDNRPEDYYPNLDFAYIDDVATVSDFYPSYEILSEIKDFNNTFIGSEILKISVLNTKYSLCCY